MELPLNISILHYVKSAKYEAKMHTLLFQLSEGETQVFENDKHKYTLQSGEILYVVPHTKTAVQIEKNSIIAHLEFDTIFIESVVGGPAKSVKVEKNLNDMLLTKIQRILYIILKSFFTDKIKNHLQLMSLVFNLLSVLILYLEETEIETEGELLIHDSRIVEIKQYLKHNYRQPLQLSDVASKFFLTSQYFSKYFKSNFGESFVSYIQQLRLDEAVRLIEATDDSLTNISFLCGFPNQAALNHAFHQAYNCTPSEYKKSKRLYYKATDEQMQTTQLDFRDVADSLQPYITNDNSVHQMKLITKLIDATKREQLPGIWNDVINIDDASLCLQAEFRKELADMQAELGFRYARLGQIMVHNIMPYKPRERKHSYKDFFRIIDFLSSLKLTPMLDLANKPNPYDKELFFTGGVYTSSLEEWIHDFKALLDACIANWSKKFVETWRFELWLPYKWDCVTNDIELSKYVEMFEQAYSYLETVLPNAEIGGPGRNLTSRSLHDLDSVLRHLSLNGITPDFISISIFQECEMELLSEQKKAHNAGIVCSRIKKLTYSNSDTLIQKINKINQLLSCIYEIPPKLYLMEYGTEYIRGNSVSDGGFRSAMIAKTFIDTFDKVNSIGYWKFCNNQSEYNNDFDLLCCGNGMIAREGIRNTAYYAYTFLSRLGNFVIQRGENYLITQSNEDSYELLAHNNKNLSFFYCENYSTRSDLYYTDPKIYDDWDNLQLNLTLFNILPGKYKIKQYLLGDNFGCLASELKRLNIKGKIDNEELQYLRSVTIPQQYFFEQKVKDNLEIAATLNPNEVIFMKISRNKK